MGALTACRVVLHTDDPISQSGIASELCRHKDVVIIEGEDEGPEVAIVVSQEIDEPAQQQVRRLRRSGVRGVVLVVARIDDQGLFAAVEAGACALLRRAEATPERLLSAIRDARAGNGNMPSDLLGRLMEQMNQLQNRVLSPQGMHLNGLSDREIQVLTLVAEGMPTTEIARQLCYSERTIKNVIQEVTTRLHLRNRSHAVAYAMRQGLI